MQTAKKRLQFFVDDFSRQFKSNRFFKLVALFCGKADALRSVFNAFYFSF